MRKLHIGVDMKWSFKLVSVLVLAGAPPALAAVGFQEQRITAGSAIGAGPQLFDEDAKHLWNRLHRHFVVRGAASGERGFDALDPLLWHETEYLLTGQSHQKALRLLDEVLQIRARRLIADPLKRALLQRDLWAVFDWSAARKDNHPAARAALRGKLGTVLWRLALSGDQVRGLPDNYRRAIASGRFATEYDPSHRERAYLPPDLFEPRGPWVLLTSFRGPAAPSHVTVFSGRSVFYVFLRLPGGRTATLDYLAKLWHFPRPWPTETELDAPLGRRFPLPLNPDLPQFPPGTQVALVRRLVLFDTEEKLMVTPVTENVQIRVYRETAWRGRSSAQDFFEFRLSRALLLAGEAGGLRPVAPGDNIPRIFGGHDVFERNIENGALKCRNCHSGRGIHSLRSAEALFPPNPLIRDPAEGESGYGVPRLESWASLDWKENRRDWGLLTALRPSTNRQ